MVFFDRLGSSVAGEREVCNTLAYPFTVELPRACSAVEPESLRNFIKNSSLLPRERGVGYRLVVLSVPD